MERIVIASWRCCACGQEYHQHEGETDREATARHDEVAFKVHDRRREAWYDAHPGAREGERPEEEDDP